LYYYNILFKIFPIITSLFVPEISGPTFSMKNHFLDPPTPNPLPSHVLASQICWKVYRDPQKAAQNYFFGKSSPKKEEKCDFKMVKKREESIPI
jgi:hypothetical protein